MPDEITIINLEPPIVITVENGPGPQGPQGPQGPTGPTGATGATGATGPSGVISVTAPITNTGTSTSAIIGVTASTTSAAGVVQLTDSVVSTSTTTAATPNSVREALTDVRDYLAAGSATAIDVFPRFAGVAIAGQTSGQAVVTYFTPTQNMTVTQITFVGGAASSGLTLARFGLYSQTTLLARTASDTTLFNTANTVYTRSFDTAGGYPSSVNLVAGTRYAVGVIQVGTTPGQIQASKSVTGITALSPQISGRTLGQTDFPTATPTTSIGDVLFARLS